jgi:hypothetical protein
MDGLMGYVGTARSRPHLMDSLLSGSSPEVKALMRKKPEERATALKDELMGFGMPEKYAVVLSKIAVRRRIEARVSYLLHCDMSYSDAIKNNARMLDDPHEFLLREKYLKQKGRRKFVRFGNLSYAYRSASQIQLINRFVKDALCTKQVAAILRKLDEGRPRPCEEFEHESYDKQREKELEEAFRFDLKVNKIDPTLVEAILTKLGWNGLYLRFEGHGFDPTKLMVMDAFYSFFSSEEGDMFLEKWKSEPDRPKLLEEFVRGFWNEPRINPRLMGLGPEMVGTPEFERKRIEFFDSLVFSADGKPSRRGDVDKRDFI